MIILFIFYSYLTYIIRYFYHVYFVMNLKFDRQAIFIRVNNLKVLKLFLAAHQLKYIK
jgi:hypothetical protein